MKKILLSLSAMLSLIFTMSCKGPKGDVGPAGQSYDPSKQYVSKDGYVKGTATGKMSDSTAFSYNIDFEGNKDYFDNTFFLNSNNNQMEIIIHKVYSGEGESFSSGFCFIDFYVPDLNTLASPTLGTLTVGVTKDLGNNKYFDYIAEYSPNGNVTASVSNLKYDSSTGILSGNYMIDSPATPGFGRLAITDGTFSTKIYERIMKKAAN